MNSLDLLVKTSFDLGLSLSDSQIEQFCNYKKLLLEWNGKMNLTAITDDNDIIIKHFIDSLSVLMICKIKEKSSLIDIGSGAGFPGIPIKIARADLNLTLIDSLNKRINFLNHLVKSINLENTSCFHKRAEDAGKELEFRECFDYSTARAVAHLAVLCEYALPLTKVGGFFIALKGPEVTSEINESKKILKKLYSEIVTVDTFQLPESNITHSIIVIKKLRQSPSEFPRKQSLITKQPLI